MRIGIVDLDTSHPPNWIPIERDLGYEIVGVWDGGSVHPSGYAGQFAAEHGIPRVFESLDEMANEVDIAILHGCDWDTHVEKARPFVTAGKSVLIDKPVAGNVRDLNQIREWVRAGARIAGGSSLRFAAETQDWLAQPVSERGRPDTVVCGCGVDEFNYGIHAYALLSGIMGPGVHSVRHLGRGVQRRIQIHWADGRAGFVVVGKAENWLPFYAAIATERSVAQFQVDSGRLYRSLLTAVLPYLSGTADEPPVGVDALLEPERCALAARRSWLEKDREVLLEELSIEDEGYDGQAFAAEYRKARYPQSK